MSRCAVCDYVEGHGYTGYAHRSSSTHVRWRAAYNEYQCDDCFNTIKDSQAHWDPQEPGEIETIVDGLLEETPALPEVPVE